MIKKPITTEKAIRMIEIDNTILFEVSSKSDKSEIKNYFEKMFNVKVEKINVLNRGTRKIAYIKLKKENPAIDIATKLGMI
ncbi:MAG: 50S ribosomal protein L23 [Candidatus Pacearchaeota archaeon]